MISISDKVVEKEFKKTLRGYDPQEVDDFLNEILDDIEPVVASLELDDVTYKEMEKENFKLKREVITLKKRIQETEKKLALRPTQDAAKDERLEKLNYLEAEIRKLKEEYE